MARFNHPEKRREGKEVFGFIIAAIGIFALLHTLHIFPSINYMFHIGWPVVMIAIGFLIGLRNNFRRNMWWILIAIGAVNLVPVFHIGDVSSSRLAGPAMLIAAGLFIALRNKQRHEQDASRLQMVTNGESYLNIENTMGGRKEIVTSKEFRGGHVRTTFGGTEINLMQADGTIQPIVIDINVSFGSIELIVPSYWEVINEIRPSMGSVEDNRSIRTPDSALERRTLVLRGTCSFGSVEVKSY